MALSVIGTDGAELIDRVGANCSTEVDSKGDCGSISIGPHT